MPRSIIETKSYRQDRKRLMKQGVDLTPLYDIIEILSTRSLTPEEVDLYKDHKLKGEYTGYNELHLGSKTSDWVLVYRIVGNSLELESTDFELKRTGSHSHVFGEDLIYL